MRSLPAASGPFQEAVKEILEVGGGVRGDSQDRFVTMADLTNPKTINWLNQQQYSVTHSQGVPSYEEDAPNPPVNFVVTVGPLYHHLTWEWPAIMGNITHMEVWVNTTNAITSATRLAAIAKPIAEYIHNPSNITQDLYYWIRCITWGGRYSTWIPTDAMGGALAPGKTTVGEAIDQTIEILRGSDWDAYDSQTVYAADDLVQWTDGRRYRRKDYMTTVSDVDPSNSLYWERVGILMTGEVDGVSTTGVDGNLVVDDTILARHVAADQINGGHIAATSQIVLSEGGKATFGDSNIEIDTTDDGTTEGRIIVAPNGGIAGNNYLRIDNGQLTTFYYDSVAADHEEYFSLLRMEYGTGLDNGTSQTIPGIFLEEPRVILVPEEIDLYDKDTPNQDQVLQMGYSIENQSGSSVRWQFTPTCQLVYNAGAYGTTVGTNSGNVTYATSAFDGWVTLPANVTSLTVWGTFFGRYTSWTGPTGDDSTYTRYYSSINGRPYLRYEINGSTTYDQAMTGSNISVTASGLQRSETVTGTYITRFRVYFDPVSIGTVYSTTSGLYTGGTDGGYTRAQTDSYNSNLGSVTQLATGTVSWTAIGR